MSNTSTGRKEILCPMCGTLWGVEYREAVTFKRGNLYCTVSHRAGGSIVGPCTRCGMIVTHPDPDSTGEDGSDE